jgi:GTPase SAR1 family protein
MHDKKCMKIAIIGDKQSGKSTLTQLLAYPDFDMTNASLRPEADQVLMKVSQNLAGRPSVAHELLGFDSQGN